MIALYLVVFAAAVFVIWKRWFQKTAFSVIRTKHEQFRASGNQVKSHHLLEELTNLNQDALKRQGGYFEFYPNPKIVVLAIPPSTKIYCYCNLMQYMDLTRAIEKKILYGVNPPRLDSVSEVA